MEDLKIIALFYQRSEQAIIELSNKYGAICRKVANNILNNRQDTEECLNANTAAKRNSTYDIALDELENCFPSADTVETEWKAKEITESINRFLACLEQDNRVMFVQRYWYSASITELAELFHTSNHNVSVRLSRIRTKLRKHLMKEGIFL